MHPQHYAIAASAIFPKGSAWCVSCRKVVARKGHLYLSWMYIWYKEMAVMLNMPRTAMAARTPGVIWIAAFLASAGSRWSAFISLTALAESGTQLVTEALLKHTNCQRFGGGHAIA